MFITSDIVIFFEMCNKMEVAPEQYKRKIIILNPFPAISKPRIAMSYKEQSKDWKINKTYNVNGFTYDLAIQQKEYDVNDDFKVLMKKIETEQKLRNKKIQQIYDALHTLLMKNRMTKTVQLMQYQSVDLMPNLEDFNSSDIIIISSHGSAKQNSLSNMNSLLNMENLAIGLSNHGLSKVHPPHIIISACHSGVLSNDIPYKFPYIYLLMEKLNALGYKNIRITGITCSFSPTSNDVVEGTTKRNEILKVIGSEESSWKYLTVTNISNVWIVSNNINDIILKTLTNTPLDTKYTITREHLKKNTPVKQKSDEVPFSEEVETAIADLENLERLKHAIAIGHVSTRRGSGS